MRNWKRKLDVSDLWENATEDDAVRIAAETSKRIKAQLADFLETDVMLKRVVVWLDRISENDEDLISDVFNNVWNYFYDWADENSVWVQTT